MLGGAGSQSSSSDGASMHAVGGPRLRRLVRLRCSRNARRSCACPRPMPALDVALGVADVDAARGRDAEPLRRAKAAAPDAAWRTASCRRRRPRAARDARRERSEQRLRVARRLVGDDAPRQRARLDRVEHGVDVGEQRRSPRTAPLRSAREKRRAAPRSPDRPARRPCRRRASPRAPCDGERAQPRERNGREAAVRADAIQRRGRDRAPYRRACRRDRTAPRRPAALAAARRHVRVRHRRRAGDAIM